MEKRKRKILLNKAGGTAGKNSVTFKISLPSPWVRNMGITEDDRDVIISYNDKKIIIEKSKNK